MSKKVSALERYKAKYAEVSARSSGGGNFMKLVDGDNKVRIVQSDPDDDFYREVMHHYLKSGSKTKTVVCKAGTINPETGKPFGKCPICKVYDELNDSGSKDDKKMAAILKPRQRIFMTVIDRADDTVKVLSTGNSIFKDLLGLLQDEDWENYLDAEEGNDVNINKRKTGAGTMNVEYKVTPKKKATPYNPEELDIPDLDELIQKQIDSEDADALLETFLDGGDFGDDEDDEDEKPAKSSSKKDIKKKKAAKVVEPEDDEDDEDEEDEKPAPKKSPKKAAKKKLEPEPEDDDEDEEDDDDEESEPVVKPKKKAAAPAKKKAKPAPEPEDDDDEETDDEDDDGDDEDDDDMDDLDREIAQAQAAASKKKKK